MEHQSDRVSGIGEELFSDVKGVGVSAANRLHKEVDARKGGAASQVKAVSAAIERAGGSLDSNAPSWLRSAVEQTVQQGNAFADSLERKDSRQLVGDVNDFARRSPATFMLACAAVGFAGARVLKAGGAENTPKQLPAIQAEKSSSYPGQFDMSEGSNPGGFA